MRNRRITKSWFPTCSACQPHSQAPFCYCTQRTVTKRAEGTFESLRYSFGGDHPSQTTHQTWSSHLRVRFQIIKGWYFKVGSTNTSVPASLPPTYPTHQVSKINVKL